MLSLSRESATDICLMTLLHVEKANRPPYLMSTILARKGSHNVTLPTYACPSEEAIWQTRLGFGPMLEL
jgi:hypothetical protein